MELIIRNKLNLKELFVIFLDENYKEISKSLLSEKNTFNTTAKFY